MAKILVKNNLAPAVYEFIIEAPMIAHKCQPGQFVMIRTDENSERIPLTIADFDREKGTITLIVQTVGNTTTHLCETFIAGTDNRNDFITQFMISTSNGINRCNADTATNANNSTEFTHM